MLKKGVKIVNSITRLQNINKKMMELQTKM